MKNLMAHRIATIASLCLATVSSAETCKNNDGNTKQVCAAYTEGGDPVLGSHFTVDYDCTGCSDDPEVRLIAGSTWTIYSEVISTGAPANIGAIFIHENAATTADFDLTIKNGTGNGAQDIGSIDLDGAAVTGWVGYSSLGGSVIAGNVGEIELVEDSGGSGGEAGGVITIIGGDVTGSITIPTVSVSAFTIDGDAANEISIGWVDSGSTLKITGEVTDLTVTGTVAGLLRCESPFSHSSTVTIADLDGIGKVELSGTNMAGTLTLENGVDHEDSLVYVAYLGGTIDLKTKDIEGQFNVGQVASTGEVIDGGDVNGSVLFGYIAGNTAEGDATFASVSGDITVFNNNLSGSIVIEGDVSGEIEVQNDFHSSGLIQVDGALTGTGKITVEEICQGDVRIGKNTTTNTRIHCAEGMESTGSIVINASEGTYNNAGQIIVGSLTGDAVTGDNDGSIIIKDDTASSCAGSGGDNDGRIRIAVCDDDTHDHEICIDGDDGLITIEEDFGAGQCTNNGLTYSCSAACQ